jgi:hypothetical protein
MMQIIGDITLLEFLSRISGVLTLIVVVIGLLSLKYSKKQIQFNTMTKCIDSYRSIVRSQQRLKNIPDVGQNKDHYILALDHLGLVNEELFYMQKNFLPKDIAADWIDNMLEYIPIKQNGNFINESVVRKSKELINLTDLEFRDYLHAIKDFNKIGAIFTVVQTAAIIENKYKNKNMLKMEILNNIYKKRKHN